MYRSSMISDHDVDDIFNVVICMYYNTGLRPGHKSQPVATATRREHAGTRCTRAGRRSRACDSAPSALPLRNLRSDNLLAAGPRKSMNSKWHSWANFKRPNLFQKFQEPLIVLFCARPPQPLATEGTFWLNVLWDFQLKCQWYQVSTYRQTMYRDFCCRRWTLISSDLPLSEKIGYAIDWSSFTSLKLSFWVQYHVSRYPPIWTNPPPIPDLGFALGHNVPRLENRGQQKAQPRSIFCFAAATFADVIGDGSTIFYEGD